VFNGPTIQPTMQPGGYGAQLPPASFPPRCGGKLTGIGVVIAVVLSTAALIVGIVLLMRQPNVSVAATPSPAPAAPAGDTSTADEALCERVGPLLREMIDNGHDFVALGDPGTPARDAGIPGYRDTVGNWVRRIQPILDADTSPPRYLTRTLQDMIDFKRLYANNIRSGQELAADAEAWNSGAIAYGGPWEICHALGVTW
jgi:hypothetical protein